MFQKEKPEQLLPRKEFHCQNRFFNTAGLNHQKKFFKNSGAGVHNGRNAIQYWLRLFCTILFHKC
jgi:hypothetical protein